MVDPISPLLYKSLKNQDLPPETEKVIHVSGVKVFYGSQTGTAKVCIHWWSKVWNN